MVKKREFRIYFWLVFACVLSIVSMTIFCSRQGVNNTIEQRDKKLNTYRSNPYGCHVFPNSTCQHIQNELKNEPYPAAYAEQISYEDTWGASRSANGKYASHLHEGCDFMYSENCRGEVPVCSMTDGVIEQMGWLYLGGWRIGIRSKSGVYYYYAHLDSYAPGLNIGKTVNAGEFLGFMGDSGYGEQGTKGKFAVHLHVGIYVQNITLQEIGMHLLLEKEQFFFSDRDITSLEYLISDKEISVNPYPFLQVLKKNADYK